MFDHEVLFEIMYFKIRMHVKMLLLVLCIASLSSNGALLLSKVWKELNLSKTSALSNFRFYF